MPGIQKSTDLFDFTKASTAEIIRIIKSLKQNKLTNPGGIPLKVIKTNANIIDSHFVKIINKDLAKQNFSQHACFSFDKTDYDVIIHELAFSFIFQFIALLKPTPVNLFPLILKHADTNTNNSKLLRQTNI